MSLFATHLDELCDMPELQDLSGTVAVVGCTGFVGAPMMRLLSLVNERRDAPCRMTLLGIARHKSSFPQGVHFVEGSIADPEFVKKLPPIDYLAYLAGPSGNYRERPLETLQANADGIALCLAGGLGRKGIIYASSSRVYGRFPGDGYVNESMLTQVAAMDLDNLYDCSKRVGESLALWHAEKGALAKVVRFTNLYGPPPQTGSHYCINDWIEQAGQEGRIVLQGHPESVRNHCYVVDAVQGVVKVLIQGRAGEAYNIGSHENLTNLEVASEIARQVEGSVQVSTSPQSHPPSINRIAIDKATRELGYQPRYRLETALPALIQKVTPSCTPSPN